MIVSYDTIKVKRFLYNGSIGASEEGRHAGLPLRLERQFL
jgi:hypothetical protein